MKTSVESVSSVEKRLTVEVPPEEVSRRIEKEYAEVRKMVPIRGFRKGKAPMSMVKRLFKEHVESGVAENLMKETFAEAVKENNLRVLSMPRIDGGKVAEGEGFSFTATFEVLPEIVPSGYKGLPAVREKVEIKEEQVETALSSLRESFAKYHGVEDRGAAEGDLVEIAYSSVSGGEAIETARSTGLILGGGIPFGKEFEDALTGAKAGENRTVDISFPEEAADKRYAGKKVAFTVTVNGIREKHLPEIDEEFVKNFNDVKDLAELRSKLRERLAAEAEERSRRKMEEEIRNGLVEKNPFEVPRSLVDRRIGETIQEMANRMASQGVDLKKVNMDFDKMRERFAPGAERSVRASLLLAAVAKTEAIEVSFQELEAEMKEIAEGAHTTYEKVREIYGDEERMDALRDRLLERKVMAFLVGNAEVREEVASE